MQIFKTRVCICWQKNNDNRQTMQKTQNEPSIVQANLLSKKSFMFFPCQYFLYFPENCKSYVYSA
jgi:hypothetical protein